MIASRPRRSDANQTTAIMSLGSAGLRRERARRRWIAVIGCLDFQMSD